MKGMNTRSQNEIDDLEPSTSRPQPPPPPPPGATTSSPAQTSPGTRFRFFTDKVAGPNVRLFDNLFSLGMAILGTIIGLVVMRWGVIPTYDLSVAAGGLLIWMIIGAIGGLIGGVLIGGLILMVIGLARED